MLILSVFSEFLINALSLDCKVWVVARLQGVVVETVMEINVSKCMKE